MKVVLMASLLLLAGCTAGWKEKCVDGSLYLDSDGDGIYVLQTRDDSVRGRKPVECTEINE